MKTIVRCIALLSVLSGMVMAEPLGTAIKYNGHFKDNGNPANGIYDVIFGLWDVAEGGDPNVNRKASCAFTGVTVEDGALSASPNFGDVFSGQAYWLEIQIKKSNQQDYTTLTPRQPLEAAAYALHTPKAGRAEKATSADKADKVNANAVDAAGLQIEAVEEGKIKNQAVTKSKLAKPAVGKDELEDAAVEETKIKKCDNQGKLAKPAVAKTSLRPRLSRRPRSRTWL